MTSQVIWSQPWGPNAVSTLKVALAAIQCEVVELPSQEWDPGTAMIGGVRDVDCSHVAPADEEWSSILLHLDSLIGEPLAAELSRLTSAPAILFLEYEQDTWGYVLFLEGKAAD